MGRGWKPSFRPESVRELLAARSQSEGGPRANLRQPLINVKAIRLGDFRARAEKPTCPSILLTMTQLLNLISVSREGAHRGEPRTPLGQDCRAF